MPKAKPKGNRRPVEFVRDPDSNAIVEGLRVHKTTDRYYRIEDGKKRIYYPKHGLTGVAYLRRATFEHRGNAEGRESPTTDFIHVIEPAYDDFGREIPPLRPSMKTAYTLMAFMLPFSQSTNGSMTSL